MVSAGRYAGKVAIVTGAAGAIGAATARRLAEEGAALALVDLFPDGATAPDDLPSAAAFACDVSDELRVREVCAATVARFGQLDVVVNVAGAMIYKPLADLDAADWMRLLGVNLLGAAYFTGAALRLMKGGAVVNVASVHAVETSPLVAPYAAAKAALLSLTRSTAIEGRAVGVRANAVLPGAVDTPMLWSSPNIASGAETISDADVGRPQDVAAAIAFLGSDDARFVTGASLAVDGGRLARL